MESVVVLIIKSLSNKSEEYVFVDAILKLKALTENKPRLLKFDKVIT